MLDRPLALVHVRKNAGSALRQFFVDLNYPMEVLGDFPDDYSRYRLFGVARNPYDRCISGWKYCDSTRPRTLLDCLANLPDVDHVPSNPTLVVGHDWRHFTATQCHYLYHETRLFTVDFLLRYENLEDHLMALCDHLNIQTHKVRLKCVNAGYYRPKDVSLTDEERSAVYNHFKEDFNLLGYNP